MTGRETQKKHKSGGAAFPRERNGYAVEAVNEYIERSNHRFEDTLYDYKRQIVELKRELDELTTAKVNGGASDGGLAEELDSVRIQLSGANGRIDALTAERDELRRRVAELSADAVRIRIETELAERKTQESGERLYEIPANCEESCEFKPHIPVLQNEINISEDTAIRDGGYGYGLDAESEPENNIRILSQPLFTEPGYNKPEFDGEADSGETIGAEQKKALIGWPVYDGAYFTAKPHDAGGEDNPSAIGCENGVIYEITPAKENETETEHKIQAEGIIADASRRSAELIAEAREEAKRLLRAAGDDSDKMRAELLIKANEEARVIKREAYLRARLMLDRINRKLSAHIDSCGRSMTEGGLSANRELTDRLVKLRVTLDDLNYTALDRASQILEDFKSGVADS